MVAPCDCHEVVREYSEQSPPVEFLLKHVVSR